MTGHKQMRTVCTFESFLLFLEFCIQSKALFSGIVRKKCLNCFCKYWVYRRRDANDNQIDWMDSGLIHHNLGVDLKAINERHREDNRFLYVECTDQKSGQKYANNHFWFVPRLKTIKYQKKRPSVLILVIESISRLNYLRHMQWTKEAFEGLGNVFYLRGLTKMADNSHPNMVPFLTGLFQIKLCFI